MELWLLCDGSTDEFPADVALVIEGEETPAWLEGSGIPSLHVDSGALVDGNGTTNGVLLSVVDEEGQAAALSFVGMTEWILLDCEDWKMIPIENLVAATNGTATKVGAILLDSDQLQGAAFALQKGVDALILPPSPELWEVAQHLAADRMSDSGQVETAAELSVESDAELTEFEVTKIETGGMGDRVCVDMVQELSLGEGLLLGSSSSLLALIHGETVPSNFVPTRPFRVNAGPVHSYVLMADWSTKYLGELEAGDEVLVASHSGYRSVVVGRLKIEPRPLLIVHLESGSGRTGQVFLQQAETVRLVSKVEKTVSVTRLTAGMRVLGTLGENGRHIGQKIGSKVEER